jgi:osmoprotectant transport system ATP-binding protein
VSAIVQLRGISKTFGAAAALHPADLPFERGKTTVLIGPSGCGKSTLLRLIIGLLEPDGGTIQFDGAPITFANIAELRRRIGYVIQDGGLFPHLTARKNVLLMATHLKRPAAEMDQRLAELCALTRFPQAALDRYPIELSGGQRQRISLMRALALSPELLLLDEPLGALDPLVRAALQKDLKEIFARLQQTAILVTHDLAEAAYLGDEIVLMNEGRVAQIGTLEDLRTRPASPFVTEFINAQRGLALT